MTLVSCSALRKLSVIKDGGKLAAISIPDEEDAIPEISMMTQTDTLPEIDDPLIMRAIRDDKTGEMIATDVIQASKVTARFRHVAERMGKVRIEFDIVVPSVVRDSKWQLRYTPVMRMLGDTIELDKVLVTGKRYRESQMKGYEKYRAFLASILPDSTDYVRIGQFEQFLHRHYPDVYAMKTDSSYVSDPEAENLFGVSCAQAVEHYTNHYRLNLNERRKGRASYMYGKYVKSPLVTEGIRLDTVMMTQEGEFIYRYVQEVSSRKGLRKIGLSLSAQVYDQGKLLASGSSGDDLVFYVSSLSTLVENTERFKFMIIRRMVYDRTMAIVDFAVGKDVIDTSLGCNGSELRRIRECLVGLASDEAFVPDSIVLTASCSPEGAYVFNERLSQRRAKSLVDYLGSFGESDAWVMKPRSKAENWEMFETLAVADTAMDYSAKERLLALVRSSGDRDVAETKISRMPEYRYLREHIYPRLRTVQLEFFLHRRGMLADTLHTTELDTVYAAGLRALSELDYKTAVEKLRPYGDYNSALALAAAGYNYTALDILDRMDCKTAGELYLKALVLSRLDRLKESLETFRKSVDADPRMVHRANLDPEMSFVLKYLNQ